MKKFVNHLIGEIPAMTFKRYFTLMEMLVVCAIILILMGIGVSIVNKITETKAKAQCRNEMRLLVSAINSYKDRFGELPWAKPASAAYSTLNFGQRFSDVAVGSTLWPATKRRPMNLDFRGGGFDVSNDAFDQLAATATTVKDPWGNAYQVSLVNFNETRTSAYVVVVKSLGKDNTSATKAADDLFSNAN